MKLVVQIPCYNEEAEIAKAIAGIPRKIEGVDEVLVLVIDDGSSDRSVERAKEAGADYIIKIGTHQGLARAFGVGLENSLKLGADIIVNIDADNQYSGEEISLLIAPLLNGKADIVVGDRGIAEDKNYPWLKKQLQRIGSFIVGSVGGLEVRDATSGFRAFSRESALRLNVISGYTYTLETLIEAGKRGMRVCWQRVTRNPVSTRPSRLYKNIWEYVFKSIGTIIRIYALYEPLKVFGAIGSLLFLCGFGIGLWFVYYYFSAGGKGHIQLLLLGVLLMIIGFQVFLLGLVSDLISGNRKLSEDALYRVKKLELLCLEEGTNRQKTRSNVE